MKFKMSLKFLLKFFGILLLSQNAISENVLTTITGVRIWPAPESTRIVFDLNKKPLYKIEQVTEKNQIIIKFTSSKLNPHCLSVLKKLPLKDSVVSKVKFFTEKNKMVSVILYLKKDLKPNSFILSPNQRYGHRLVVDLEQPNKNAFLALFAEPLLVEAPKLPHVKPSARKQHPQFVIAIDAGHGGEDPGAIGKNGTQEKVIALKVAQCLQELVNQQPNMKGVLIRTGDYYLGLQERVSRARLYQADLFVSIHADAYHSRSAEGASVFTLSERGASSVAAKMLAERENKADVIGGISLSTRNKVLASVLLDLSQTASQGAGNEAALHILKALEKLGPIHKRHVEQAGFAVLKAPDIPSLLVETGFISHPKTEAKLNDPLYQKKLARAMLQGIQRFFDGKMPVIAHNH